MLEAAVQDELKEFWPVRMKFDLVRRSFDNAFAVVITNSFSACARLEEKKKSGGGKCK